MKKVVIWSLALSTLLVFVRCEKKSTHPDPAPVLSMAYAIVPPIIVVDSDVKYTVRVDASDSQGLSDIKSVIMDWYRPDGSYLSTWRLFDDGGTVQLPDTINNGEEYSGDWAADNGTFTYVVQRGISSDSPFAIAGDWTVVFKARDYEGHVSEKTTKTILVVFPFTGICQTDSSGNIISDDPSDWQPRLSFPDSTSNDIPSCYGMAPVYPNPTSDSIKILYALPRMTSVVITINSLPNNEIVKELLNIKTISPGYHSITWDGKDAEGNDLESGVYGCYFYAGFLRSYGDIELARTK